MPTAPRKAVPPSEASCSNRCLLPSTSQACTWLVLICTFCVQPVETPSRRPAISRQLLEAVPLLLADPDLQPGGEFRRPGARTRARAPSSGRGTGRARASSARRPKSRRGRATISSGAPARLQQEADEDRPGDRAEEGLEDPVHEKCDDRDAGDREHALVEDGRSRRSSAIASQSPRGCAPPARPASRNRPARRRGCRGPCRRSAGSRGSAGETRSAPRRARSAARS